MLADVVKALKLSVEQKSVLIKKLSEMLGNYQAEHTGLRGNGIVNPIDACILKEVGKWMKNKGFIYEARACDIKAKNADILQGGDYYYAVINDVPMSADTNMQREEGLGRYVLSCRILKLNGWIMATKLKLKEMNFFVEPFLLGKVTP